MSLNVYPAFCARIKEAHNYMSKRNLLSAENAIQSACDMTFDHYALFPYRERMHDIDRALMFGEYSSAYRMVIEFMEKLGI